MKPINPCNNCGQCCRKQICHIGYEIFPDRDEYSQCPAIQKIKGKVFCGLVRSPQAYKTFVTDQQREAFIESVKKEMRMGKGCTNPYKFEPVGMPF